MAPEAPILAPRQPGVGSGEVQTGESRPRDVTVEHVSEEGGQAEPTLTPPGATASVAVTAPPSGVTGTWTSGVTVDATWSANETRNAYFHVAGGAWKKIFNARDGVFVILTALVSQARQTGHQIAMREEADGMVHEIYLW